MIHTVKVFGMVNKAEVDVLLESSCFFFDPTNIGNLISGCSAFCMSSLNIWKFTVHVLLKPALENFEHYFAGVWDECYCAVNWTFFVTIAEFSKFAGILSAALSQHHLLGFEMLNWNSITSTSFVCSNAS